MKKLSRISSDDNRGELLTEKSNKNSKDLDMLNTLNLVKIFSNEDLEPQRAVSQEIPQIAKAIDLIAARLKSGGRLFYLGTGTSGRLGALDASECPPTFCSSPELVQAIIAGGDPALRKSSEGLEDLEYLAIDDLNAHKFTMNDVLVGITAGGTTQYVKAALTHASAIGASTVAITCVPKQQVKLDCDIDIRLLTGPELLTGSTRLKAATATKMTLNMISTIVMIRLGKVYGNRMVDVAVKNIKLHDRALRILGDIADVDRDQAEALLKSSNGSVKLSLLMAIGKIDLIRAQEILSANDNYLRPALDQISNFKTDFR